MIEQHAEAVWFWLFWVLIIIMPTLEAFFPHVDQRSDWEPRWTTNMGFGLMNGALNSLSPALVVLAAHWAQTNGVGLLNVTKAPLWLVVVATVSLRSFTDYGIHLVMHKVPLFWRLHRVHHSDHRLDVSTGLRFHPFENAFAAAIMVPVTVAFGLSPAVIAVCIVIESTVAIFTHVNLRLPPAIDRGLSRILVTPVIHSIHHSAYQPETDSNFGNVLVLWDKLFGTFCPEPLRPGVPMRYGLDEIPPERAMSLWWQVKSPIRPAKLEQSGLADGTEDPKYQPSE